MIEPYAPDQTLASAEEVLALWTRDKSLRNKQEGYARTPGSFGARFPLLSDRKGKKRASRNRYLRLKRIARIKGVRQ